MSINLTLEKFPPTRRVFRTRVRVRIGTGIEVRRCLGHPGADGGRSSRCLSLQDRKLSHPDEAHGLASYRGGGAAPHNPGLQLEGTGAAVPQSRRVEQSRKLEVPLHLGSHLLGPQSVRNVQELRPGINDDPALSRPPGTCCQVCQK